MFFPVNIHARKNLIKRLRKLHFALALQIHTRGMVVLANIEDYDAKVTGSPRQLLKLLRANLAGQQAEFDKIDIRGDMEFAQALNQIFARMDIDWEEHLARIVGDSLAHHVGRQARGLLNFRQRLHHSLKRNISDYVQEEKKLFPPREMVEDFYADIRELQYDVARMEQRLKDAS